MGIVTWIIFGGLAGWIGTMFVDQDTGLLGNIVIGIIGASVGGFVAQKLGARSGHISSLAGFFWAVVGSVILLVLFGLIF